METRKDFDWGYARIDELEGLISCYDKDGYLLGTILANPGDWELMLEGRDPISEGWEDGIGNTANINGWG
jgi:hypothetical protein